jgi:5-methyltetrahydrofolate--homocysteine methyltransferase
MSDLEVTLDEMEKAIRAGDEGQAAELAARALAQEADPLDILQQVIVPTLKDIGDQFGRLEIFLPEMMLAAEAAKAIIAELDPVLKAKNESSTSQGRVVIGTVAGDVHDIGKNMVATMLEVNGFEVIDLGTEVSVETFLSTARSREADIIAMSSLLTTSLPYMKDILTVLQETGEKSKYKVMVGGGPLTSEWARENGADGYGKDAAEAVTLAHQLIS